MGRSVLVVDDDPAFRDLAGRILASWGHVVIGEAGSVEEAVAGVLELRPDTVLADIGLPDGDGFELARRLATVAWQPRVVLISSDSDAANDSEARRMGASGFVPKDDLAGDGLRRLIEGG